MGLEEPIWGFTGVPTEGLAPTGVPNEGLEVPTAGFADVVVAGFCGSSRILLKVLGLFVALFAWFPEPGQTSAVFFQFPLEKLYVLYRLINFSLHDLFVY